MPTAQSQLRHRPEAPHRVWLRPAVLFCLFLWFLIWSGYNTGVYELYEPGFPTSTLDLIQGLRVFLPILAGWLALVLIFTRSGLKKRAISGPLGLMLFFAAAGVVSSAFLSPHPIRALCWAAEFAAVILVLMAAMSQADGLDTVSRLMTFNWMIGIAILIGLLGAIPFLGHGTLTPAVANPLGVKAYSPGSDSSSLLGVMPNTRNTGLARYAGVAGVVALARLLQGKRRIWLVWLSVLLLALYSIVLAQARTETISFAAGLLVIFFLRRRRRIVMVGLGTLSVALLWLLGFFQALWEFGIRARGGHHFDWTLTGRTFIWAHIMKAFWRSPWVGYGFRSDRYVAHADSQSSFFHALIQSGVLGTVAFVAAFVMAWYLVFQLYRSPAAARLLDEVPAILMFFTVMSVTESVAWYTADWLLFAPVLAYIQVASWQYGILGHGQVAFHCPSVPVTTRRTAPDLR